MDVSGSQQSFVKPHHNDLQTFLKTVLQKQDRAFLVCFGNNLRLMSDYSNSPRDLVDALKEFEKGKNVEDFPTIGPREHRILGTAFYDAIYHSSTQMMQNTGERSRRALIVFSDGEDNSSAHHMLDAIEAAQSGNVRLYALRYTESKHGRFNARNKYGTRVMERLARETGGAHYDARAGDIREWFQEIGEELRATYELAYPSTNPNRDGTFRKIVIRPKRTDLTVRAKTGYFARP
jgi:Ca-activated chloride channel family protein